MMRYEKHSMLAAEWEKLMPDVRSFCDKSASVVGACILGTAICPAAPEQPHPAHQGPVADALPQVAQSI